MKKKGFTFVEILMVLIVVGILFIGTAVGFNKAWQNNRVDTCEAELREMVTAFKSYITDYGTITVDPSMDSFERLMYFNRELFSMIENSVSLDLLAQLLSTQLTARGERHLLDRNRTYFKVLRKTVKEGQERGELRGDVSANEIVKAYALTERALLYDWCLCSGEYSLSVYANPLLRRFSSCFKAR